jgi:hypothetical protein
MKAQCPLHGEQEFLVNENLDAHCSVCYWDEIHIYLERLQTRLVEQEKQKEMDSLFIPIHVREDPTP